MTSVTPELRARIYRRDRGRCHYCGDRVPENKGTLDHRTPRSKGGKANEQNLVLSCLVCNHAKANMTEYEFMALPHRVRRDLRNKSRSALGFALYMMPVQEGEHN